jgi:hypothetical protein
MLQDSCSSPLGHLLQHLSQCESTGSDDFSALQQSTSVIHKRPHGSASAHLECTRNYVTLQKPIQHVTPRYLLSNIPPKCSPLDEL